MIVEKTMRVLSLSVPLPTAEDPNTMAPLARQLDSLRQAGVEVDTIEIDGPPKLKYPMTLVDLYRALPEVDLVHAHYGYAGWLGRCQLRKPLVVSFMGSDLLGIPDATGAVSRSSALTVAMDRWFARTVDTVIVKSPQMAEIVAPVPCHVVPNGVDIESFRPLARAEALERLGWSDGVRRILFAGNPARAVKGYPLAEAATAVARTKVDEPIELVALHQVDGNDVPLYMNACDVMIMASFFEGSPNVVKEAMACDLPVVSVPVGDVEHLFDGVGGYVVRPRDAEELGLALSTALMNQAPVEGRAAILAKGLDLESVAQRLVSIYREVIA